MSQASQLQVSSFRLGCRGRTATLPASSPHAARFSTIPRHTRSLLNKLRLGQERPIICRKQPLHQAHARENANGTAAPKHPPRTYRGFFGLHGLELPELKFRTAPLPLFGGFQPSVQPPPSSSPYTRLAVPQAGWGRLLCSPKHNSPRVPRSEYPAPPPRVGTPCAGSVGPNSTASAR